MSRIKTILIWFYFVKCFLAMFLSYVVFLGDLISIYLEKNILNLTFEENYVSALAVWWQTNVFQRSWWSPVWTSSKCFLTPLSSISINLYYVLYIWLWLPDLIKVIAFCYTTRARAISVVTKPRHRVVITRHIPHILSRDRAGTGHRTTPR